MQRQLTDLGFTKAGTRFRERLSLCWDLWAHPDYGCLVSISTIAQEFVSFSFAVCADDTSALDPRFVPNLNRNGMMLQRQTHHTTGHPKTAAGNFEIDLRILRSVLNLQPSWYPQALDDLGEIPQPDGFNWDTQRFVHNVVNGDEVLRRILAYSPDVEAGGGDGDAITSKSKEDADKIIADIREKLSRSAKRTAKSGALSELRDMIHAAVADPSGEDLDEADDETSAGEDSDSGEAESDSPEPVALDDIQKVLRRVLSANGLSLNWDTAETTES